MPLIKVNWNPNRRALLQFGLAGLVAFGLLGGWALWRHSLFGVQMGLDTSRTTAYVLWGLASLFGLLAVWRPGWLAWPYVVLTAITLPIGFVISHVILAVLFFLVFTPIGLVLRLFGRDLLERKLDSQASSYWQRRQRVRAASDYFRQF